ncbi:hypothetical protein [Paenibacillus mendelii]|uniref:Uncharacterized protein n=1 Tax=Paenibacillus mendelii TaxID=206163 RepID=A0ABV6JE09_9BACL|nr:hypothetical protein [Paenibacillus mendelii]MCQ6563381.1 hypothetical protein [Paenibacillus mendelii]
MTGPNPNEKYPITGNKNLQLIKNMKAAAEKSGCWLSFAALFSIWSLGLWGCDFYKQRVVRLTQTESVKQSR